MSFHHAKGGIFDGLPIPADKAVRNFSLIMSAISFDLNVAMMSCCSLVNNMILG